MDKEKQRSQYGEAKEQEGSLKSAMQLYQYCIDNGLSQGMNRKWGIKHFALIAHALQNHEEVKLCFIGLHNYISSSKHDKNFAYAITNKRIIMAQKKLIGQTFQSVSLNHVNDISMNLTALFGVVTIDTIREKFNVGVGRFSAQNINDRMHEILFSLKEPITPTVQNQVRSEADELLKYKNLLDMGAITLEEFEHKKKHLLGL